jgi:hypothetical protein
MMNWWRPLAASLALLIADPSYGQKTPILGASTISCGEWVTNRQQLAATRSASTALWGEAQWILGYVTAMNSAVGPQADFRAGLNESAMMVWVDDYCHAHALDSLGTAASALVLELSRRAAAKPN